jgi:hypothetical protein
MQLSDLPILLNEGKNITYYEIRQFLTTLYQFTKDTPTRNVIKNLLATVSSMEIRGIPVFTFSQNIKLSKEMIRPYSPPRESKRK